MLKTSKKLIPAIPFFITAIFSLQVHGSTLQASFLTQEIMNKIKNGIENNVMGFSTGKYKVNISSKRASDNAIPLDNSKYALFLIKQAGVIKTSKTHYVAAPEEQRKKTSKIEIFNVYKVNMFNVTNNKSKKTYKKVVSVVDLNDPFNNKEKVKISLYPDGMYIVSIKKI